MPPPTGLRSVSTRVPGVVPFSRLCGLAQLTVPQKALPQRSTLTITVRLGLVQWPARLASAEAAADTLKVSRSKTVLAKICLMERPITLVCGKIPPFSLPRDEPRQLVARRQPAIGAGPDLGSADESHEPAARELEPLLVDQFQPGRYVDVVVGDEQLPRPAVAGRTQVGEDGGSDDLRRVLCDFALPSG